MQADQAAAPTTARRFAMLRRVLLLGLGLLALSSAPELVNAGGALESCQGECGWELETCSCKDDCLAADVSLGGRRRQRVQSLAIATTRNEPVSSGPPMCFLSCRPAALTMLNSATLKTRSIPKDLA